MDNTSADSLRFLPIALDLRGRACVVIGGGSVGTRKVRTLVRAGANVTIVSPNVTSELFEPIDAGQVRWVESPFREEHIRGAFLVIAATDDETLNAAVVQSAAHCGALVCDASSAERSQVIFGALLKRNEQTIAVFSDGRDPARSRRTRDRIAELWPPENESHPQV